MQTGRYSSTQPVLRTDGSMCFNPGDACAVLRNESDAAGSAAFDALADALNTVDGRRLENVDGSAEDPLALQILASTGMAFVVDNRRVLHGRLGRVEGRRRVIGGEAPASVIEERWAEVAAV